jgi:hypothetical protein
MRRFYKPMSFIANLVADVLETSAKVTGSTVKVAAGIVDLAAVAPVQYVAEKAVDGLKVVKDSAVTKAIDLNEKIADRVDEIRDARAIKAERRRMVNEEREVARQQELRAKKLYEAELLAEEQRKNQIARQRLIARERMARQAIEGENFIDCTMHV